MKLPITPFQLVVFFAIAAFTTSCSAIDQGDLEQEEVQATTEAPPIPQDKPLEEMVIIGSQHYLVPESWQGHKIDARSLSRPPLVQVPPEFVLNNGQIFILPAARDAFIEMAAMAREDDIRLQIDSGYRSAWYQKKIYQRQLEKGKSFAQIARFVAPPGYSEHMLGLAVDFVPSNWRFADSPAYLWLLEHGRSFGFRETYPETSSGGRPWEPSHWRYHSVIHPRQNAVKFNLSTLSPND